MGEKPRDYEPNESRELHVAVQLHELASFDSGIDSGNFDTIPAPDIQVNMGGVQFRDSKKAAGTPSLPARAGCCSHTHTQKQG